MRLALLLLAPAVAACSTQREFTLATRPAGAEVWINQRYVGASPVTVPFVHYGRFEVRAEKPGYRTRSVEIVLPTPLDGRPLVDLPGELMVPRRSFRRTLDLEALPADPGRAGLDAALERAREMRAAAEAARDEPGTPEPTPREEP